MERKGDEWRIAYLRGKTLLSRHDPEHALKDFESALEKCPVNRVKELGKILYYLGVTLQKLGMPSWALRSWSAARKLDKRNYSGKFLSRFSNPYGMVKQVSCELDDWNAYHSVQLCRYLSTKRSKKLGTDAERDMIMDLIHEGYRELCDSVNLAAMDSRDKMTLFRKHRLVFPTFNVPSEPHSDSIPVNFQKNADKTWMITAFAGADCPISCAAGAYPGMKSCKMDCFDTLFDCFLIIGQL